MFQFTSVGGFGVQPSYIGIASLFFLIGYHFITNKVSVNLNPIIPVKSLILLQASAGLALLFVLSNPNADVIQFIKSYSHFLFLTLFALTLGIINFESKVIVNIFRLWIIVSILLNIFGIYQLFARAFDLPLAWIQLSNVSLTGNEDQEFQQLSLKFKNFYRATSIFSEPSALAGFNLTIIGILIAPMFKVDSYNLFKSKTFMNVVFILSVITLFVTFSLTAVMGLGLLGIAYVIYNRNINYLRIFKTAFVIIILMITADVIIESYFETSLLELFYTRIANILGLSNVGIVGESFSTRGNNFISSFQVWMENPIIGVGLGQTKFFSEAGFSDYGIMHALMETGIIGGFFFIMIFVSLIVEMLLLKNRVGTQKPELQYILNSAFYLTFILIGTNFISGNSFINLYLWLYLGIIMATVTSVKYSLGDELSPINFFKKKSSNTISIGAE
jgi:hypothetical protein